MKTTFAIIGSGNVGTGLSKGLSKAGFKTRTSGRDDVAESARDADAIILAIPFGAIDDVVSKLGNSADGKIVIDVTNTLLANMQMADLPTSGAEELQKKIPKAKVVKAFYTVFAQHMDSGKVNGQQLTAFVAADDDTARKTVLEAAASIGFDPVNAGPLANAMHLESLAYMNIFLGDVAGNGPMTGFKYIK